MASIYRIDLDFKEVVSNFFTLLPREKTVTSVKVIIPQNLLSDSLFYQTLNLRQISLYWVQHLSRVN